MKLGRTLNSPILRAEAPAIQGMALLMLAVILWAVYGPGLSGPYVFDDFQNITRNPSVAIGDLSSSELLEAAFSQSESGLGRPVAMFSFALNYFLAGKTFDPFAFKATNLVIHIVNVVIVFLLTRLLFQSANLSMMAQGGSVEQRRTVFPALFAAALWGLHPLQLTSVLYTVQRMNSLSAFFVLLGMLVFLHGRTSFPSQSIRGVILMTAGVAGGTVLGMLCKENAILLPLLAATVEVGLFSRCELSVASKRKLLVFYTFFLILPALVALSYILIIPEFIYQTYTTREFSMTERLLTQSRALFFYLSLIFLPLVSRLGLFHDDFALSTGVLDPPTTLLALIAWAVIAGALVWGLRRRSLWAFGLAWFLVGHALESSILGLEIMHEHRNYVPSVGVLMAGAFYFLILFEKLKFSRHSLLACGLSVLLTLAFVTHTRAISWSSRPALFETLVRHHPESYRAINGLATGMVEEGRDVRPVYNALRDASIANPSTVHGLIEMKKILRSLIPISDRFELTGSNALSDDKVQMSWSSDLVLSREYLLYLDSAITPEISRRLALSRIHVETVNALRKAQECVRSGIETCASLSDEVLDWHLAVLPRLPRGDQRRAMLELSTAKMYAVRGELEQALEFTDRAIETTNRHPRYLAQKAMLLIQLGDLETAKILTNQIEEKMDWRKMYSGDINVLRREIERAAREQTGEQVQTSPSKLSPQNANVHGRSDTRNKS